MHKILVLLILGAFGVTMLPAAPVHANVLGAQELAHHHHHHHHCKHPKST